MTTHHQAAGTFVNSHPSSLVIAREEPRLSDAVDTHPDQEISAG
jgi:hypothetical protein